MISQAIIANGDFVVSQKLERIYEGDFTVDCNAIMKVFLASRPSDIEGGTLFTSGCASLNEASLIISAGIKKAVFNREPLTSDELCAIELLKEQNVSVTINPDIILE